MHHRSTFCGSLLLLSTGLCGLCVSTSQAQGTLPATAPTNLSVSQLPSARPENNALPESSATALNWDGNLLQVHAGGASLNGLLRSIAAKTGTAILGSVPEDRIFGDYGPAPLAEVIAELLDGMPVNVLFVDRTATKPAALTLTSRNGAATPPMPSTPQADYIPERVQAGSFVGRRGLPTNQIGRVPVADVAAGAPSEAEPVATGAPAAPATSENPASPNGVKTPEEIFEQLQRLRATSTSH